ncbi:MAG: DUF4440 domain-containing protein [Gemmatimonadetes bacterium]|nr:DUF4440 domain-containing protein [Gemmatimonadota bacterium]
MRYTRWLGAALALAAAGCQATETAEQMQTRIDQESAAFRAVLDSLAPKFQAWAAAGQVDSIANLYMENANLLPANEPMVVGREAIRAKFTQWFSWGTWTYTISIQAALANGPIGLERGTYSMSFAPGPNAPAGMTAMAETGKYLVHWHNMGGQWMIADDIGNSDRPMMPPPATTRRRG